MGTLTLGWIFFTIEASCATNLSISPMLFELSSESRQKASLLEA